MKIAFSLRCPFQPPVLPFSLRIPRNQIAFKTSRPSSSSSSSPGSLVPAARTTLQCKSIPHTVSRPSIAPPNHSSHAFSYLFCRRSGVSHAWRSLGQRMFFSSPWDSPHLICHPNQLFCLVRYFFFSHPPIERLHLQLDFSHLPFFSSSPHPPTHPPPESSHPNWISKRIIEMFHPP